MTRIAAITEADVQQELDATGLYCPEPVMLLHNRIRDMAPGDLLRLTATDPSTSRDVPKFCLYLGHELVASAEQGGQFLYLIRKANEDSSRR
ncbi:MAG: sulfurtransferase TusA [Pseudohongiellaceae bacterium]